MVTLVIHPNLEWGIRALEGRAVGRRKYMQLNVFVLCSKGLGKFWVYYFFKLYSLRNLNEGIIYIYVYIHIKNCYIYKGYIFTYENFHDKYKWRNYKNFLIIKIGNKTYPFFLHSKPLLLPTMKTGCQLTTGSVFMWSYNVQVPILGRSWLLQSVQTEM